MFRELIDTDLEAVAGGFNLDLTAISQKANLVQKNNIHSNAFALGFGATAASEVEASNSGTIVQAV
jgi:hypothetical protein